MQIKESQPRRFFRNGYVTYSARKIAPLYKNSFYREVGIKQKLLPPLRYRSINKAPSNYKYEYYCEDDDHAPPKSSSYPKGHKKSHAKNEELEYNQAPPTPPPYTKGHKPGSK